MYIFLSYYNHFPCLWNVISVGYALNIHVEGLSKWKWKWSKVISLTSISNKDFQFSFLVFMQVLAVLRWSQNGMADHAVVFLKCTIYFRFGTEYGKDTLETLFLCPEPYPKPQTFCSVACFSRSLPFPQGVGQCIGLWHMTPHGAKRREGSRKRGLEVLHNASLVIGPGWACRCFWMCNRLFFSWNGFMKGSVSAPSCLELQDPACLNRSWPSITKGCHALVS